MIQSRNQRVSWLLPSLVAAAVAAFLLLFHQRHVSGLDPADFVLMLKYGYSVWADRPHPPGYPGFYVLWTAIADVTGWSPLKTIQLTNIGFSVLALALAYWVGKKVFGEGTARRAMLLVATNPLFLFYGCTSEIYAYDTAFGAFAVMLLLAAPSAHAGRRAEIFLFFLYGLLGAFRLSSVVLTMPVVLGLPLFRFVKSREKRYVLNFLAVIMGTLCWFIPYTSYVGGLDKIWMLVQILSHNSENLGQNLFAFASFHFWTMNIVLVLVAASVAAIWRKLRTGEERYVILVALIAVPATYFAAKYYAKGYALVYLVPFSLLTSTLIGQFGKHRIITGLAIAANLAIFFALPFSQPSARSMLNYAHRTTSEREHTALDRATSYFAPTFSRLGAGERAWQKVETLLNALPDSSIIIVETPLISPSARALQVEYPSKTFLQPLRSSSERLLWYHGSESGGDFNIERLPSGAGLFYLTISDLTKEIGAPPGALIASRGGYEIYSISFEKRDSVAHWLDLYFVQRTPS